MNINKESFESLDFENIKSKAIEEIKTTSDLFNFEKMYLSKEGGILTRLLSSLGKMSHDDRKKFGAEINEFKTKFNNFIFELKKKIKHEEINLKINSEKIDVSAPSNRAFYFSNNGYLHPITKTIKIFYSILEKYNFTIMDGTNIEDDIHNFSYLNTPEFHPARSMHDSIYIDENSIDESQKKIFLSNNLLLRTHTSPGQIRISKKILDFVESKYTNYEISDLSFQFASIGKTYRNDSDATHSPMFHQLEMVSLSKQTSVRDLMSMISDILKKFFDDDSLEIRIRSSYFPFTQPSWEVDLFLKKTNSWVEVLGCGMIHPNVIENMGLDSGKIKGYALGAGIERLCMLKHSISDLRLFYGHNIDSLKYYSSMINL